MNEKNGTTDEDTYVLEHIISDIVLLANREIKALRQFIPFARHDSHDVLGTSASVSTSQTRKPLFDKILIANRGEIAVRVIQTARKLGVRTVAVYSDADRNSMHTKMADEAIHVGPAASSESYLQMDRIIEAARKTGAQAIHPCYGFLSENSQFADLVEKSGLTFIGPPVQAIIDMGSKSASKEIMERANVPVVPGYHGDNQDVAFLKSKAEEIGYPILIKAIKGGGGKGMRIVDKPEDFEIMLESSKREATKSFGDDTVLIEKYLTTPRHVEVQVFADKHDNAVYLFERDCSVQRRHQKILEEAPAPGLSEELRRSLGEKAVAAAKAVGYVGAGTVEFIMDTRDQKFYFMEMNTRLQVEHPISEMITNTDLVQWQLEVASGNLLPKMQDELSIDGHAFEARIYAENPRNNFLPDVGPLVHMRTPEPRESLVRVETGVKQGDEVSVHYDPMISKLVVKGVDRSDALRRLERALGQFEVVGLNTNIEFLKALSSHPSFRAAEVETGFIAKHEDDLFPPIVAPVPETAAMAALGLLYLQGRSPAAGGSEPFLSLQNIRLNHDFSRVFHLSSPSGASNGKESIETVVTLDFNSVSQLYTAHVLDAESGKTAVLNDISLSAAGGLEKSPDFLVEMGSKRSKCAAVLHEKRVNLFVDGIHHIFQIPEPDFLKRKQVNAGDVVTPMPSKISQILVKEGEEVITGQPLIVLEAMKMEHVIRSPNAGKIQSITYKEGEIVPEGKRLLTFED